MTPFRVTSRRTTPASKRGRASQAGSKWMGVVVASSTDQARPPLAQLELPSKLQVPAGRGASYRSDPSTSASKLPFQFLRWVAVAPSGIISVVTKLVMVWVSCVLGLLGLPT